MQANADRTTTEDGKCQTDRSRVMLNSYLDALLAGGDYGRYMAEAVTFTMTETGEVTRGRDAVVGLIDYLHTQALAATPVIQGLVVDGSHAVLEAEFVGSHVGEFAGIGPTGRQVRVPYVVVYDFHGGSIAALRLYLPMDVLVRQLRNG